MGRDIRKTLKRATQAVQDPSEGQLSLRTAPLPSDSTKVEVLYEPTPAEETTAQAQKRRSTNFVEVEISGSKGKRYKVTIPASYKDFIPKVWEWDTERYAVADMIGEGIPIKQISDVYGLHRTIIYAWLEHPEFKDYVDAMVMESGMANRRERIQQLSRLSNMLVKKVANELDTIKLNEKSIGPVLATIGQYAKHLAQEKDEFVESSKIEQSTTLNGTVGIAALNLESVLNSAPSEDRKRLEDEFDKLGNDIIRSIVGDK